MPRSARQHAVISSVVFAGLIVALLFVGSVAFDRLQSIASAAEAVERSQRALRAVDQTLLHLVDAESNMRGFLLTAEDFFQDAVAVEAQRSERALDELGELLTHDATRSALANEFRTLVRSRLTQIRRDVRLLTDGEVGMVHAPIRAGDATVAALAIRAVAERIRAEEKTRFAALDQRRQEARAASQKVFAATLVIALVLGCVAVLSVIDGARRARRIEAALADRVAAEGEVRAREGEMVALANSMPQLVWAADSAGHHNYFNQRWYDYTGMSSEESAAAWQRFLHPDDAEHTMKVWTCCTRSGEPYQVEYRLRRADGSYRWFMGRAVPLRDPAGRIVRWLGTSTDIDEERRLSSERDAILASERSARSEAERASRLKDEFVATVSHELRTPLNAVLGWVRILRNDRTADTIERGLEVIERNAESQARLVDDLLDTSRVMAGKLRLELRPVHVATVITESVETSRPAAAAKEIALDVSLEEDVPLVAADPNRIRQVMWNLISNAIKFTPRGGRVSVALTKRDRSLRLTVRDTGQGIPPDFLPSVFDRFRQADGSTTRRQGGLGLGLAVVRALVELHGGAVSAESPGEDRGSTFIVDLPIPSVTLEPLAERGRGDHRQTAVLAGADVLVVDDDRDAREVVARLLEDCGATVRLAATVSDAIELYRETPPTIIVSDIGMPEQDGVDLIRQVRELEADSARETPAVALSALARPQDRDRSLDAGFDVHIAKPVEPDALMSTLARLIARRSNERRRPPHMFTEQR